MLPPADNNAPISSSMPTGGMDPGASVNPVASATPDATPAPSATATPGSSSSQAIVSVSGSTATITGKVVATKTGAFQIQGGSGLGYIWIYTTSTTKFSGAKPYVGENVEVTGTGSIRTSIKATSVTQLGTSTTTGATPKPAATTAPVASSSTNVAHYAGCPVFAAGGYYNAPISGAAIDPNSANYINAQRSAGNSYGFYASTGYEKVNQATGSTPMLTVKQKVSYHSFPVKYPWQSGFYIEPLGDAHGMVVQTGSCHLYESYSTSYSGGVLSAYSGANWDMTKAFVPMAAGTPSAMASGLSIFAGMVKWEDYQSGAIRHALNWAAPAHTVAAWKFVRPASDTDGLAFTGSSAYQLPYGAHLRLKASFSTAGMGPEATMVVNAMKTYGIYLADTGSGSNALYFANASNGSDPWNHSDLSALSKIHITDFDVVKLPTIQTVPGH